MVYNSRSHLRQLTNIILLNCLLRTTNILLYRGLFHTAAAGDVIVRVIMVNIDKMYIK